MWLMCHPGDLSHPSNPFYHLTQVNNPTLLSELTHLAPLAHLIYMTHVTYLKRLAHLAHDSIDLLTHLTVPLEPPGQSEVPTKHVR
jgi:hypothetical protein